MDKEYYEYKGSPLEGIELSDWQCQLFGCGEYGIVYTPSKGLPLRSGSGPAAILWSPDSVIRMEYVGGNAVFRFSTLSSQSSILAQNSVIEYDGDYFWIGVDRFLVFSGGKVQELPNQLNKN